jgi:hypothetical protein
VPPGYADWCLVRVTGWTYDQIGDEPTHRLRQLEAWAMIDYELEWRDRLPPRHGR